MDQMLLNSMRTIMIEFSLVVKIVLLMANNASISGLNQLYYPIFYDHHFVQDGDRDHNTDRARMEVRLSHAGAVKDQFCPLLLLSQGSAKSGETINYQWYFYVQSDIEITNEFCHIHQVKSDPPTVAAQPPIITYTLEHAKFAVKHIDSKGTTTTLKEIPASQIIGKWVYADETLKAGSNGWFETTIYDAASKTPILSIPRISRDMWRDGDEIHPKFGVYRHHGNWHTTHVAFSDWKVTTK